MPRCPERPGAIEADNPEKVSGDSPDRAHGQPKGRQLEAVSSQEAIATVHGTKQYLKPQGLA